MSCLFLYLQASVAQLEQQLADCESALVEEKTLSQERKHQTEQSQCQVTSYSLHIISRLGIQESLMQGHREDSDTAHLPKWM